MKKFSGILFFYIIYSLNCICNENFEILLEYENCYNINNTLKYNYDKKGNKILEGYLEIDFSFVKQNFQNFSIILKNIYNNTNISYIILKRKENLSTFYLYFSQYGNEYENIININFIECENIIRNFNNINQSQILYLIQFYKSDYFNKNKYEYKYTIINQDNQILNLSICNIKIKFTYPLKLLNLNNDEYILAYKLYKKNINIFDSNSPFFNDICFKYSFNKKNINIDDRRKIFYKYYAIFNQCNFKRISFDKNISICLCPINVDLNYNKIFKKIILSNIQIIKCYYNFFNKQIYKNIGFYIELLFLIGILIIEFYWYYFTLKYINEKILEIITIKTKNNITKDHSLIIPFIRNYTNQLKSSVKSPTKITSGINSPKLILNSNLDLSKNSLNNSNINQSVSNTQLSNRNNITIIKNPSTFFEKKTTIHKCININIKEIKNESKITKEKNEKKNLRLVYWDMLKIHHYIFNFFFYKFQIIPNYSKIIYILNSINTFFLSSVITYSKSYIHEIFVYDGSTNSINYIFKYQYYKIITSIFFHFILNFPLSLLSYYTFNKAETTFLNKNKKIIQIIRENKLFKQKITIYFCITFIINIFSIYYITIFCSIFTKIQINFILSSLMSIIIQSILSIFILFIISIIFMHSKN
jgi:hypothetical protein